MGKDKIVTRSAVRPGQRRRDVLAWAGAGLAATTTGAWGQTAAWPSRTITLVCPFPAGNATDVLARTVAEKLQSRLGATVVVDNRVGGGTAVASNFVRNAPPDGHTIYLWPAPVAILSVLMPKTFNYDPLQAFTFVGGAGAVVSLLAVHPNVPANTVPELVAWVRTRPAGTVTWGITAQGATDHLMALQLQQRTGLAFNIVPYKGGSPALQDLLAGRLDINVQNWASSASHIQAGKLKMLATLGSTRPAYAPHTSAMTEVYPGLSVPADFGIVGPRGIPKAIVDRLERELLDAMKAPDTVAKLNAVGLEASPATAEQFVAKVKADFDRQVAVVRAENLRLEE